MNVLLSDPTTKFFLELFWTCNRGKIVGTYTFLLRKGPMGMVLVEHDSTCRHRRFESVSLFWCNTMVTVWVSLSTDLDFFWIVFGEMIVRVPFYYLTGSEYGTSHSIIMVRLCRVLLCGDPVHLNRAA